ncbi:uncharacterized protein LOC121405818 [Lytechinus variegatus]|uniref:uncharacterized protein LOC121405818 n=1 Tax=Lytechinus variegatus TaxID=7654 RepID=UPI001BB1AA43|nr:uncharacterized protein LOC121405818 [Lytechinus variegatus]XP_041452710.1 uncharacterized protein LOC121405818 [Lytechinus variegatus]XP_041452711.1 uncharacterized protein LOC121405818 [Lytechinus variegatus]XP_041452712.1 uncharacterized protein LOC121405818 [Lytechinus variegatus]XP_041452713.1 uncharacterized protein LOC121405818 [Lytechinus variegatus]
MREFTLSLAFSVLVVMVSGQLQPDYMAPFTNPGEIVYESPLTIKFAMNAVGGIWQQSRAIDSLAYACTSVLPVVGSAIPAVDETSLVWGFICDEVVEASSDLENYDARGFCVNLIEEIFDLVANTDGMTGFRRRRRQAFPSDMSEDVNDPIIETLINSTRDLYGIDINMIIGNISDIDMICTNIKDNFLRPSLKEIITTAGGELGKAFLPLAAPICEDYDGFLLQTFQVQSPSLGYNVSQIIADLGSLGAGYDSMNDLCEDMDLALSVQGDNGDARRMFASDAITDAFGVFENADRCTTIATGVINDVVVPLERVNDPSYEISNDDIYKYTGFSGGVPSVCTPLANAFTNIVDLVDAEPVHLIPETTLTVPFFLNAAGGIWKQSRLIDSMAFICSDVMPELESMVPALKSYFDQADWDYNQVCDRVQEAANNLAGFDAEGFCNDITQMIVSLFSDARKRRQAVDPPTQDPLELINDITKRLYNIDITDMTTICPNIGQFLDRSINDIYTEIETELMVAYLPEVSPFLCENWNKMLESYFPGVENADEYIELINNGVRIVVQLLGYDSRQDLCDRIGEVQGQSEQARRNFAQGIIESSSSIYVDTARCSMFANDVIDDVIQPLFDILGLPIKISDYTIYRYTGYMGVEGVCRAIETAFTVLSVSEVTMTLKAESMNGIPLEYTDDLADKNSNRFQELEELFCGVTTNFFTQELGDDLRDITCRATAFRPGSIIAELQFELHAISEEAANTLADDAVELASSDSLTISGDGNSLTLSEVQVTTDERPGGRGGLSTGAIIGIVVGVLVALIIVVAIIAFAIKQTHRPAHNNAPGGRGIGMQNPGYTTDEKPRYA